MRLGDPKLSADAAASHARARDAYRDAMHARELIDGTVIIHDEDTSELPEVTISPQLDDEIDSQPAETDHSATDTAEVESLKSQLAQANSKMTEEVRTVEGPVHMC